MERDIERDMERERKKGARGGRGIERCGIYNNRSI